MAHRFAACRLLLPLLLAALPLPALAEAGDMVDVLPVDDLRAGQFVWQPERSRSGPVEILISVPDQKMYVLRGGVPIGVSAVSTGKPGHGTPAGSFTILQKNVHHRSNLYSNAPMPYMQRLTWGGIAIHAGHNPGRPASHGCIRVPRAFAQLLYGATTLGAAVTVTKDPLPRLDDARFDSAVQPMPPQIEPQVPIDDATLTQPERPPAPAVAPVQMAQAAPPAPRPAPRAVAPAPALVQPVRYAAPAPDPNVSIFDDMVSYTEGS
jgi:hypothetical protein